MQAHPKLHMAKSSSWRHVYEMREGDTKIAMLELHNSHGSSATIHGDDFKITINRTKFLPKEIELHDGGTTTHTFHAGWNSKGALTLHGKKYFWLPANKTWTAWKWEDEKGNELLRLSYNPFRPFAARGRIQVHPSLPARELRYLGLLGWYLILLDFELTGSRVLSALELGLRRLKTSRAGLVPPFDSSRNKKEGFVPIFIAIAAVLIALLVSSGYVVYRQHTPDHLTTNNSQQQSIPTRSSRESDQGVGSNNSQQITQNQNSPANTQPQTSGVSAWKTYLNEKYGFEIKYPPDWRIREVVSSYSQEARINSNNTSTVIYLDEPTYNKNGVATYYGDYRAITVFDANPLETVTAANQRIFGLPNTSSTPFVIDGTSADYYKDIQTSAAGGATAYYDAIVMIHDNKLYRFVNASNDRASFDKILSTFTFTSAMSLPSNKLGTGGISMPSSTVVIRGTVLVNDQGCAADGACFLTIQFDNGKKIDVNYGSGLTPSGACYHSEGFGFKQGDRVEISGKFSNTGTISLCEPNTHIRKI